MILDDPPAAFRVFAAAGIGTETGGSIVSLSSANSLVGLKRLTWFKSFSSVRPVLPMSH